MNTSGGASTQQKASALQNSPIVRRLARAGYAVNGLLHLLIGGIALGVAFGGSGEADQDGALSQLAQVPAGQVALWIVVIGLWGLGLFQLLEVAVIRGTDKDAWADRAKEGGKAIAYLAIGFTAYGFATGGGSDSSTQTQSFSAQLLSSPGGRILLGAIALGVIAIGVYFIVKGAKKKFLDDISRPGQTTQTRSLGKATEAIGVFGYCAKGVAIAVVGILFGVAAVTTDASQATGLDGALRSLAALPFGMIVLTLIALGLIAYGVYCFIRARYARL